MKILDYLEEDFIKIGLDSSDKNNIIKELLEIITKKRDDIDKKEAYNELLKRENVETTAIGSGIAIPHARIKAVEKVSVALAISKKPVDFNALDNKPVKIFFLLLTPEKDTKFHLRFLARISRILRDKSLKERLIKCNTKSEVIKALNFCESKHVC